MDASFWAGVGTLVRDISLAGTLGSLVLVAAVLPGGPAFDRTFTIARVASVVWAVVSAALVVLFYIVIDPQAPARPGFGEELWWYITQIPLGQRTVEIAGLALVTSAVLAAARTRVAAAWAGVPVMWALVLLATLGHASSDNGNHHLGASAMFVHILGASLWLGVVMVLVALRAHLGTHAANVVARTAHIAKWAVVLVLVSGVVNAALRLSSVTDLWTTAYGALLLVKIVMVIGALIAGSWYQIRILPQLRAGVRATFWKILAVEVVLLALATGLAAVLSRTAPVAQAIPVSRPSPALLLTGYDLPAEPTLVRWLTEWRLEIVTALALAIAATVYAVWVIRLRRRGDSWPAHRVVAWYVGLITLAWATQGAPSVYGLVTFSAHMIEHMVLVSIAPVALVIAAPVTLALRALPPRTDNTHGPREWLRVVVESRVMAFFAHPIVAAVNFAASMFVFYYSPIFEWVLHNHAGHVWMVGHFVLVGYLFANALVGVDPGPSRPAHAARLGLLFVTMAFHAFFGIALMMSEALLAPRWFGLMGRDWGPDALTDQQLGGQIAWGIGELPVIALAIAVAVAWRRSDEKLARRSDRVADRNDDQELKSYNDMLARLTSRSHD